MKSPCDVTVMIYHQTPQDGTYEWQPGAVCHHTSPGDQCTIIIEYTINCHGAGGGQAPGDSLMGEGDAQGTPPDPGMPQEGEVLPDNGGPPNPIPTLEPPLGPEEDAGDLHYLRQVIEEAVTPQTSEAELQNKNNALAAYLLQLNPELFQELSMLFLSINHEQDLIQQDRRFLWEKAYEFYNITKNQEHALPYHSTLEEFLNSLTTVEKESYTESITTTALLPAVKSLTGLQWPQSTQEWEALFQLLKPMLIEVGIEFLPLGGIYNAIDDMAAGLSEGDYTTAAIGFAGVLMEFTPWAKLLKAGRALFSIGKKAFTIFKIGYNYIQQLGDAIALGLKTTLEGNTVKLLRANGDEVARISSNTLHISKHGIKAAEGSVVFRSADEVNAEFATAGLEAPYKVGDEVIEFVTQESEVFVRVFTEGSNLPNGRWIVKLSDIEHIIDDPQAIQNFLALPNQLLPNKIVTVNIPANTRLRTGIAGPNFNRDGGILQFEIPSPDFVDLSWFSNIQNL
ncbi:MAG: hypothetical protein AAF934_10130 [Bacteroidota bacterium]